MQEGFAKSIWATNILRPAIDVSFWAPYEEFLVPLSFAKINKKMGAPRGGGVVVNTLPTYILS